LGELGYGGFLTVIPAERNDRPEFPEDTSLGWGNTSGNSDRLPEFLVNITVFRVKHNDVAGHNPSE
jgi:hypothetical protein